MSRLERAPSPLAIVERRDGGPPPPAIVLLRRVICASVDGSVDNSSSVALFCIGSK